MKANKIFSALALSAIALTAQAQSYTLTADLSDMAPVLKEKVEGKMMYIVNPNSRQNVDSAMVKDAKFTVNGTVKGDSLVYFAVGANRFHFVQQAGNIVFKEYNFSGTPLNDQLNEYNTKKGVIFNSINERYQEFAKDNTLTKEQQVEKGKELMDDFNKQMEDLTLPYLDANKDNALNALLIEEWLQHGDDVKKWDKAMAHAGKYTQNYRPIQVEKPRMETLRKTQEGMPFIDFTVEKGSLDGKTVKFSDYIGRGKYVLVDFWASWCGPCRGEIPNIKQTYEKYHGDKFDCLSIAVWDQEPRTRKALEEENMPWPQIINSDKIATDAYGIIGIPQIILFAPDGTIAAKGLRGDNVEETVKKFLGK